MVEVRIIEAEKGFSCNLGVKFGAVDASSWSVRGSNWSNVQNNNNTNVSSNRGEVEYRTWSLNPNVSLPMTSATSGTVLVRPLSSGALGLKLPAPEELGKSRTLPNPHVLTQDRKEVIIESGTEIPYQGATLSGAILATFKKAVLGLTVTPNITPDGQIIMAVEINKDPPINRQTDGLRTKYISTKNLNTQVMVEDGDTLIVGGIYEEESSNTVNKALLLGDTSVVGNLSKFRGRNGRRRELLILITPCTTNGTGNNLHY